MELRRITCNGGQAHDSQTAMEGSSDPKNSGQEAAGTFQFLSN